MDWSTVLILAPLPLFGLLTPAVGQLHRRLGARNLVPYWTMAALVISLASALVVLFRNPPQPILVYGVLSFDAFSMFFAVIFLFISTLVNIASISYMRQAENNLAYYGLLLFSTFGMMLVALSVDLVALFV